MHALYSLSTLLLSILVFPLFLLRERGRARIFERYGFWNLAAEDVIWFHAASMGEVNGIIPLINKCRQALPDNPILLTSTSVTGLSRAEEHADFVRLLPFDHALWISRALRGVKVKRFILAETELWPGLLRLLSSRRIPASIVNGKISSFTFGAYSVFRGLFRDSLKDVDPILAGDEESRTRFISLSAKESSVKTAGNSKYDVQPTISSSDQTTKLRAQIFSDTQPVLVLGSLRPGEEKIWFPAIYDFIQSGAVFQVVVAPRHKEKFEYFAERLLEYKIPFVRRTERRPIAAGDGRVLLLDTLGELEKVYSFATMAFIGGTIENWGGHNPLEAAAYGACIALGPHCSNVAEIAERLKQAGALVEVSDRMSAGAALELIVSGERVRAMGQKAYDIWKENTGATERIFAALEFTKGRA